MVARPDTPTGVDESRSSVGSNTAGLWHFDGWTLHADTGDLNRNGQTIRLADQPSLILQTLLARPGELVTREELIARLWPTGVVDFDTGLNSAVRKLRAALHDTADAPRYIETVPRKGYRFIGHADPPGMSLPQSAATPGSPSSVPPSRRHIYVSVAVVIAVVASGIAIALQRPATSTIARSPDSSATVSPGDALVVLPLEAAADDEAAQQFALTMTEMIRERLARMGGVTIVAGRTANLVQPLDAGSAEARLKARYLLRGVARRENDRVLIDIALNDTHTDRRLWSTRFDRPAGEITAVREEIARRVAADLRIEAMDSGTVSPVDLDAYALYVRGRELLASHQLGAVENALELFQRATILDPRFAQAYVGLGQAKLLRGRLAGEPESPQVWAEASRHFDRAIELDPALGEAWIEHARLTREAADAEALYLRGLQLAPNYGVGHLRYAEFLFDNSRAGEAIEVMDRARAIDPLTPNLHVRQAFFVMVARSDVEHHRRLLQEALAINPRFHTALHALAYSHWEYTSEWANAAELIDRTIAVDPQSPAARMLARDIYLDLGDPETARAMLLSQEPLPRHALLEVAQYENDRAQAAKLVADLPAQHWIGSGPLAAHAEALRDSAIFTGDYATALARMEQFTAQTAKRPRMWYRGFAVVHAHTLVLAGDIERGRRLAESTLAMLDTHSVGRTPHWFSRERASAFAVLGDDERALDELELSVRAGKLYRWWYVTGIDPIFERVREHPRFAALNERAQQQIARERDLLAERRASSETTAHDGIG